MNNITATFLGNKSRANIIEVLAGILNLVSFSLFDRHDSDKPEMILYIGGSLFNPTSKQQQQQQQFIGIPIYRWYDLKQ